jgi:HSP20 family molecular chaperone IbpA
VPLPEPIDVKTAKVEFQHGMVHVSVAKEGAAEAVPKRAAVRKAPKKSRSKLP